MLGRPSQVLGNSVAGKSPWYMLPYEQQLPYIERAPEAIREQIRQFVEDGVILVENAISDDIRQKAIEAFVDFEMRKSAELAPMRDENGLLPRIINLHAGLRELLDVFLENSAIPILEYLFDSRPSLYTTLFFQKGSAQDIHRDTPFFSTMPPYFYVGFWTALDAATLENGALNVIRGGHLRPELDLEGIARQYYSDLETIDPTDARLWMSYQERGLRDCLDNGLKVETLPVPAGATVIWHPHLPHGGSPIHDRKATRRSLVVHTTPTGVPVYHENAFFNPKKVFPEQPNWKYHTEYSLPVFAVDAIGVNSQIYFYRQDFEEWAPAA